MVRWWHADPLGFLRPWNEVPAIMAVRHPQRPLDRHWRGCLPDGVASSLSKLSRGRLQGVHPDLVRVVECACGSRLRTSGSKACARVSARRAGRARRQPDHELPASHRPRHRSRGAGQSAIYDTDGFANLGAQPTRLAAPPARVSPGSRCCAACSELLGDGWVEILKNRVEIDGLRRYLRPTVSSRARIGLTSGPIAAADGTTSNAWSGRMQAAAWTSRPTRRPGLPSSPLCSPRFGVPSSGSPRPSRLRIGVPSTMISGGRQLSGQHCPFPSGPRRERKRIRSVAVTAERSRSKYRDPSPQGGFP
jgi:hypothetical protein